jgi:C-terminal processing protease CtpA/Prc
MKIFPVLTILCVLAITAYGQGVNRRPELNLGFEKRKNASAFADNWDWSGRGYNVSIDTVEKHGGAASLMIESKAVRPANDFGFCGYTIPAIYEGEEIELRAWMKLQDVKDGEVGLMLRIDGDTGTIQFDNMQSKKIQGTRDWALYSVKLPLPAEGKKISIGSILTGTGKIWADDLMLLIDGQDISLAKIKSSKTYKAQLDKEFDKGSKIASIPLDARRINDLAVLGNVWGYLKYYHPAVNKGEYNWDYELFRVLPKIIECKNDKERNEILLAWIDQLGPTDVGTQKQENADNVKIAPDLKWIEDANVLGEQLSKRLTGLQWLKRDGAAYYVGYAAAGNPDFKNEKPYNAGEKAYTVKRYPDVGFRLLALYRYWNIIQYYFPYKHLIEEDWKKVLPEFIPAFVNAANALEYGKAALSLIERVNDTHANIYGSSPALEEFRGLYFAPLLVTFIENKAVITRYLAEADERSTGLKTGDIITAVNGVSVDDIIKARLAITPASNYSTKLRNIANDLLRGSDTTMTLTYQREQATGTVKVNCYLGKKVFANYAIKDTCFKYVTPDIGYIYMGTIKKDHIADVMPGFLKTKGIIIDLRCYPSASVIPLLTSYLMPKTTPFVHFTYCNIVNPGYFTFGKGAYNVGKKNSDYYKGQVVILVNEQTQSAAEYAAMAYRAAPRTTVVGSTTAGADGNVSWFYLPGGIYTCISGLGVYYPDKRETQRVGIVPDVTIRPTIKGFTQGRDEVLEKAIEIINKGAK